MQTTLTFEASATATSSFIETQFPIARLSAESEAARMLAGDLEMIMLDANETFQQMQPT